MVLMRKWLRTKNKRGFTLIELLVVIAVMGLLASIATIAYSSVAQNARKRVASATINNYWGITSDYFYVMNSGFGGSPSLYQLCARTGLNDRHLALSKSPPASDFPSELPAVYVQYDEDPTNVFQRYVIVRLVYQDSEKGKYYYSTDGINTYGPFDTLAQASSKQPQ